MPGVDALSVCQDPELVSVGIGQHDGAVLARLELSGAKRDKPFDLRLPITVNRYSQVGASRWSTVIATTQ